MNTLIRTCLLEDRSGESVFGYNNTGAAYNLKWSLNNSHGLVFVAVYQKALKLLYVDDLLDRVNRAFALKYKPDCYSYPEFDATFQRMLRDCEAKTDAAKRPTAAVTQHQQQLQTVTGSPEGDESEDIDDDTINHDVNADGNAICDRDGTNPGEDRAIKAIGEDTNGAFNAAFLNKKLSKRTGPGVKAVRGKSEPAKPASKKSSKPQGKQARRWDDLAHGIRAPDEEGELDFTDGKPSDATAETFEDFKQISMVDVEEEIAYSDEEEDATSAASGAASKGGLLASFVRSVSVNVIGTQGLTRDDVAPALVELKKKLMERNVAEEIAEK